MHISDIEAVIKSLQKSQNAVTDILKKDDNYLALQELPSQQNAHTPHDIICGANLRARLGLKYGGQAIIDARLQLDAALQHFEEAISLVGNTDIIMDAGITECSNEEKTNPVDEMSICQKAAENAVALAMKFGVQTQRVEEDNTQRQPTALIEMHHIKGVSDDVSTSATSPVLHEATIENTNVQLSELHEDDETPCYQIQGNTFSLSGSIAATIMTLVAIVTVVAVYSEPALAAKYFFQ